MSKSPDVESTSAQAPVRHDPQRGHDFAAWLEVMSQAHALDPRTLRSASADASFRRYFRVQGQHGSRIIMDAPPLRENCAPFVQVAQLMRTAGLRVPEILAWDQAQGFMLLDDLGPQTLLQIIQPQDEAGARALLLRAIDALILWQKASRPDVLPPYDHVLLRRELDLFPHWYVHAYRQVEITSDVGHTLEATFVRLIQENLSWPQVYVHRDFMPRNLMAPVAPDPRLGVLDFQDAVYGPITYDIASLMRDAFLSWDESFCLDLTVRYWDAARKAGLPVGDDFGTFYRGVEWMGLQRHLKVAGIFARLSLRDGKPLYLADTPRFIGYIRGTCARYRELGPLLKLIDQIERLPSTSGYAFGRT